jgi:hypothetical protein
VRQTILGFRAEALEVRTLPRNLAGSMSDIEMFQQLAQKKPNFHHEAEEEPDRAKKKQRAKDLDSQLGKRFHGSPARFRNDAGLYRRTIPHQAYATAQTRKKTGLKACARRPLAVKRKGN